MTMSKNKLLVPGLIGAGALTFFIVNRNSDRLKNNLRFQFKNIENLKLNLSGINLKMNFDYINPEKQTVKINTIFADIILAGRRVGGIVDFSAKELKGKTKGVISFPVTISAAQMPALLEKALDGDLKNGSIDGYFDLQGGRVSFKQNFDILV